MRLQSSIEFLSTYGFMLILLVIVIGIIAVYFLIPDQTTLANQCNSFGGIDCDYAIYNTNSVSHTANIIFQISNFGVAPINVLYANVIVNNRTFSGQCAPEIIDSGSASVCYATVSPAKNIGTQIEGFFVVHATVCNSEISQFGNASSSQCTYTPVSYSGDFFTYASYITATSALTSSIYLFLQAAGITPSNPTIYSGNSITLSASGASGGSIPYSYKWYSQASCLGALIGTGSSISVGPLNTSTYSVRTTDKSGASACSSKDIVHVIPILTVSLSPGSQTYWDDGQSIIFISTASGGIAPYTYQWYSGSSSCSATVAGATGISYTTTPAYPGNYYCVQVTDSTGNVITSNPSIISTTPLYCYNSLGGSGTQSVSPSSCGTTPPIVFCAAAGSSNYIKSPSWIISYSNPLSSQYKSLTGYQATTTCQATATGGGGNKFDLYAFGLENPPTTGFSTTGTSYATSLLYTLSSTYQNWFVIIAVACASTACSITTIPTGCTKLPNQQLNPNANVDYLECIEQPSSPTVTISSAGTITAFAYGLP